MSIQWRVASQDMVQLSLYTRLYDNQFEVLINASHLRSLTLARGSDCMAIAIHQAYQSPVKIPSLEGPGITYRSVTSRHNRYGVESKGLRPQGEFE